MPAVHSMLLSWPCACGMAWQAPRTNRLFPLPVIATQQMSAPWPFLGPTTLPETAAAQRCLALLQSSLQCFRLAAAARCGVRGLR